MILQCSISSQMVAHEFSLTIIIKTNKYTFHILLCMWDIAHSKEKYKKKSYNALAGCGSLKWLSIFSSWKDSIVYRKSTTGQSSLNEILN